MTNSSMEEKKEISTKGKWENLYPSEKKLETIQTVDSGKFS